MKHYFYKMNAGMLGTEEVYHTKEKLDHMDEHALLEDHAGSFGVQYEGDGLWADCDENEIEPEMYLWKICETDEELLEVYPEHATGCITEEEWLKECKE